MVTPFRHLSRAVGLALLIGAIVFATSRGISQDVSAIARADSSTITIGDWLNVYLEISHPAEVTLGALELPDSIPGLEFVKKEAPTPAQNGGVVLERAVLTITAFDSGSFQFPALTVPYRVAGDSARRTAATLPIDIVVHGIAVDTSQAIKDIKPPMSLPLTFMEILPYKVIKTV